MTTNIKYLIPHLDLGSIVLVDGEEAKIVYHSTNPPLLDELVYLKFAIERFKDLRAPKERMTVINRNGFIQDADKVWISLEEVEPYLPMKRFEELKTIFCNTVGKNNTKGLVTEIIPDGELPTDANGNKPDILFHRRNTLNSYHSLDKRIDPLPLPASFGESNVVPIKAKPGSKAVVDSNALFNMMMVMENIREQTQDDSVFDPQSLKRTDLPSGVRLYTHGKVAEDIVNSQFGNTQAWKDEVDRFLTSIGKHDFPDIRFNPELLKQTDSEILQMIKTFNESNKRFEIVLKDSEVKLIDKLNNRFQTITAESLEEVRGIVKAMMYLDHA